MARSSRTASADLSGTPASVRRVPTVKTVTLDGGARLLDPDTGRERYLNETGLFVWSRLDGRPVGAIATEVAQGFAPSGSVVSLSVDWMRRPTSKARK